MQPTPRDVGFILGLTVGHMPLQKLAAGAQSDALADAGIDQQHYYYTLVLICTAATLHAIETAGLSPDDESTVASGLYDWIRTQPPELSQHLLDRIEDATEDYALAQKDDLSSEKIAGKVPEVELEYFDRLMALGENTDIRARACTRLTMFVPYQLWEVQLGSAFETLAKAGLAPTQ